MREIPQEGIRKNAKDLAGTVSAQANYIIKSWLVLIAASAAIAFPNSIDDKVILPFSFGKVDKSTYDLVMFFIQAALIVVYCQGFAKVHQANEFAQEKLEL